MAQVSTPARLLSVAQVFGAVPLHDLNRGGPSVLNLPSAYPSVNTSGIISLYAFTGLINPTYTLPASMNGSKNSLSPLDAYVWVSMFNDGTYTYGQGAGTSGNWKVAGGAGDWDIMMVKTAGDTPNGDAVNTWLNLGTSRTWFFNVTNNFATIKSFTGYFQIREANSPFRAIAQNVNVSLYAEVESNPCPLCCFTPETLITMANYSTKPIVDVRVGDLILTRGGSKEVTEIITREFRVMYQIHFADGRILNASEDHPLYVEGKGYAAINPVGKYKDLGMAEELAIGDFVLDVNGKRNEIVSIADLDYPHTVYTFAESEFYANGMLVY